MQSSNTFRLIAWKSQLPDNTKNLVTTARSKRDRRRRMTAELAKSGENVLAAQTSAASKTSHVG